MYLFFCTCCFAQSANKLSNYNNDIVREKSIRAAEVIGFFSSIEIALDKISIEYPELNPDVYRIKHLYNLNFGLSKINALNYLKENSDWVHIEKKIDSSVNLINRSIETKILFSLKEDTLLLLVEIENKIKGKIESPILENILSFQYQDYPHKEFINGFTNNFSTNNHLKSKNAIWSIKYPKSWLSAEGDGQNIIQKFIYDCGNSSTMVTMATSEIPLNDLNKLSKEEISNFYQNEILNIEFMKNFIPDDSKPISFEKMKISDCQGGLLIFESKMERLGIKINMKSMIYLLIYKNYMHFLQCSVGSSDMNEDIDLKFKKFKTTFQLIANSIKVIEKEDNIIYLKGTQNQKIINVNINNKNYDFILDTGATHSLISIDVINELKSKKIISQDNFIGKNYAVLANGKKTEIEIWKIPSITVGKTVINNIYFSVINETDFIPLLGMDILQSLNIWKIDLNDNKIYLKY